MLYLLIKHLSDFLESHHLGFLRVFTFITFQTIVAVPISFLIVLFCGPRVIAWLRKQKIGDNPDFDQEQMNEKMKGKAGTPTMGGILIILAIVATTILIADLKNFYVLMALICLIWLGAVGAADDWLKLTAKRRGGGRQGLTGLEKLLFQIGLSVVLCVFTYDHGQLLPAVRQVYFPFFKELKQPINLPMFIVLGTIVITGFSNAVNLTDGLDGLAAGCMGLASFTFAVLAVCIGVKDLAEFLLLPYIQASEQMAVLSAAMMGACLGFLWFNCAPASVFMGDTGSLAMGGLIGYIAIVIRQELLLVLVGGIFVVEALSVMIQVGYFKYTKRKYGRGRRIFKMAPLHHHFQQKGWPETQVVIRFWLIGVILAAMALVTVKLR
ncbi:MAG TPA: phospho-N-acetylmuramoyl-pentapeptide-transferase [Tepidisphaeraceae bacterium]|jgi:phospho-N-acetylmuramoyl-pentapeptide-transferase|nr:phospho-N-acetylmuramoyl-pentapeptide-transferase [Tepidisphaeraceae bacterium]